MIPNRLRLALAWAALVALPAVALAQAKGEALSYRCIGADGKRYYGQTMPPACVGRPVELLNPQGVVVRRIEPAAQAEKKADKKADAARPAEDASAREQRRRDQALLATYASEAEIESARQRALAENERDIRDTERRIEALRKHRAEVEQAAAAKKDAKAKGAAPRATDLENVLMDLKAQEELLEAKKKNSQAINDRFEQDRRRFRELTEAAKK